jgi:hypothetical protein
MVAPTWSYTGANLTLERRKDDGEDPCEAIQVLFKTDLIALHCNMSMHLLQ